MCICAREREREEVSFIRIYIVVEYSIYKYVCVHFFYMHSTSVVLYTSFIYLHVCTCYKCVLTGKSGAPLTQTLSANRTRDGRLRSRAFLLADMKVLFRAPLWTLG